MSGQPPVVDELLARRLALVARISALNAEALRLTQALAGAEMEVLRCELAIGRGGDGGQLARELLAQELLEAGENAASLAAGQADCEARIAQAEKELRAVDLALAAGGPASEND